jgi:putative FmdB family regulatory protein
MPTYEYRCRKCGEHLEVVQSFKDDPLTTCPNCGGDLRKVFGNIGITFKGSGFYKTDSRPAAKSESSSSSSSDGKPSESKPSESKPSESKPSESKPSESKPAETKKGDSKKSEASSAAS